MTWNPYPPLPRGAIRDLLGVTRVLYRAAAEQEPRDETRIQVIEKIGQTLRTVVALSSAPPGTIDHGNAWAAVDRARELLTEIATGELAAVLGPTLKLLRREAGSMV